MRKIKFRAWDLENEKMILSYAHIGNAGRMYTIHHNSPEPEYIVMQYTGLKDASLKEIYEGDIVRFGSDPAEQIIFKDGAFRWGGDFEYILQICEEYNIEVIGNIYETPELLDK